MNHIFKITNVRVVQAYGLEVTFSDGVVKIIDLEPVLYGEMYSPLRDIKLFNQVKVDSEVHTIVWPNGADFDPATLYNWDKHVEEISRRCKDWETVNYE